MISSLIYEVSDFIYTIVRLSGRIVCGVYSWYNKRETNKLAFLEKRIIELEEQRNNILNT